MEDPKKYKFGSLKWQNAMLENIKEKFFRKEKLNDMERAFIQVQAEHLKRIKKLKRVI
jgi:hypothetical protein